MTKNSIGDHCNNYGDKYSESTDIFNKLHEDVKLLTNSRPELNKKLKKQRRAFLGWLAGFVIGIAGLIIAVIALS